MTRDDIVNYLDEHKEPYYPHTLNRVLDFIDFEAKEKLAKKSKWHNLRKNPDDLPDNDRVIILKHTNGSYSLGKETFDLEGNFFGFTDNESELGIFVTDNIESWKDIE